ncbi:hypothetical protein [Pusillimonas sp.]|uniref:DNA polymerase III subunit beta family protein n=1 Tax=Pusillimonas sp. TaxID=3040095 RepID=UPI0037CCAC95
MTTINVSVKALKAAVEFAAKKDIRYYLNGVLVQASADETRIVGTDGHILGAFREDHENDVDGTVELIIPYDVIQGIKLTAKQMKGRIISLTPVDEGLWQFYVSAVPTLFKPVDGKFPEYQRVIPTHDGGVPVGPTQYNDVLLSRVGKAIQIWTESKAGWMAYRLVHAGDGLAARIESAVVKGGNFVGAIMPIRAKCEWSTWHSWAKNRIGAEVPA